ncbi:MAG: hypothetical protein PCFJNLEI_00813 [Verrucomicrobiae bacterium]|nr:hypothetical protein [Verrucomicrobiae bacterium]
MQEIWRKLDAFCRARDWRGFDPYDGLNSPLPLPGKFSRQVWTQFHRRSPVNLRPLCGIAPTWNVKGLALFALGNGEPELLEKLRLLRNADGGWGYPFPWQSRAFYAPRGTSNLICTAFAAKALQCDVTEFVANHLLRQGWIAYIAGNDTQVHNINLIGAALIGRRDCMEWSVKRQRADGSWWYGEAENQHWIDNFHTGYNLVALQETGWFPEAARRGFEYWDKTFWTPEFAPRYYHDREFPYDTHCSAQGILTYLAFGELKKANAVAEWAIANMWDDRGFFWYQRGRWFTNRVCYMRWTQAWMYYALAELIKANENR